MKHFLLAVLGIAAAIYPPLLYAQFETVVADDLNSDSSADYSILSLNNNGTITFAYDYSSDGIPPAPRTVDGTTLGLKITANDTIGSSDAYTLFHNTSVRRNARATVDLYLGVTGSGGTTEFGSLGLGSTGTTPFTVFSPVAGDGTYLSTNGDGDVVSDWRFSRPSGSDPSISVPVNPNQPDYLLGGTDAALYTGVLPPDGIAGNEWVTISIETIYGITTASINGTEVIRGPSVANADGSGSFGTAPGGLASMSYADVFTSIATPFQSQFGIFDNFLVEDSDIVIDGDYNDDGTVDGVDYAVWRESLGAPVVNGEGADGNRNGIIDGGDLAVWADNFGRTFFSTEVTADLRYQKIVPEPPALAAATLALLFAASWLLRVRNKSSRILASAVAAVIAVASQSAMGQAFSVEASANNDGNWVWQVTYDADADGGPAALEFGANFSDANLISGHVAVTDVGNGGIEVALPGNIIFGWETLNEFGYPEGLQLGISEGTHGQAYFSFGTGVLAGSSSLVIAEFVTEGPATGGSSSSSIEIVSGRISQETGTTFSTTSLTAVILQGNFDNLVGVDGTDFIAWQRYPAVGNLTDWESNYGSPASAFVALNVPEPSTCLLIAFAVVMVCGSRYRK